MKGEGVGIKEMCCPICGKTFAVICEGRWAYKRGTTGSATIYYCSYGCTVKAEREREEKAARSNGVRAQQRAKRLERLMYIEAMLKNGMTYTEIAKKLGLTTKYVRTIYEDYQKTQSN